VRVPVGQSEQHESKHVRVATPQMMWNSTIELTYLIILSRIFRSNFLKQFVDQCEVASICERPI
jgi:hypothetical protein